MFSVGRYVCSDFVQGPCAGYMKGHQISRKIGIDFITIALREVSNLQVGRFWGVYSQPDSHTSPATRKDLLPTGGFFAHLKMSIGEVCITYKML